MSRIRCKRKVEIFLKSALLFKKILPVLDMAASDGAGLNNILNIKLRGCNRRN